MTHRVLTSFFKQMRTEKGWLFKFGVASFFFFGLLFLLWSCSSKNPTKTEKVGSLYVYSNVSGADIELDDKPTGEETPYTFENIKVGSHKVSVTKEGYFPKFDTVEVEEGRLATVFFSLTNKVGKISVNSYPHQGAEIYLDQVNTQQTTPYTLDSVPVGEHIASVKMPGFLPSPPESLVIVYENDTSSAEFELFLDTLHGSLRVSSDPIGATIVIDTQATDKTTNHLFLSEIPIGTHLVSVFKEEYSNNPPAKHIVEVKPGETTEVTFNLNRAASVGPDSAGQLAPDFELFDDYDELIKLYNYRGFVVIVQFWADYCDFCKDELDFLQEQYDKYYDDSLKIFAVNYEDGLATIKWHREDKSLTYHLLVGRGSQMLEDYHIWPGVLTPITIFIDRSGLIHRWVRGYDPSTEIQMRQALYDLLGHD